MPRRVRIEGYAIVSADSMIADRNRQTAPDDPARRREDSQLPRWMRRQIWQRDLTYDPYRLSRRLG